MQGLGSRFATGDVICLPAQHLGFSVAIKAAARSPVDRSYVIERPLRPRPIAQLMPSPRMMPLTVLPI